VLCSMFGVLLWLPSGLFTSSYSHENSSSVRRLPLTPLNLLNVSPTLILFFFSFPLELLPALFYFKDLRCITITILDLIHRPVFYLKHDVLETGLQNPVFESPSSNGPNRRS
jgi:hypothetical protein